MSAYVYRDSLVEVFEVDKELRHSVVEREHLIVQSSDGPEYTTGDRPVIVMGDRMDEERHGRDAGCVRCHQRARIRPLPRELCQIGESSVLGRGDSGERTSQTYGADEGTRRWVRWSAEVAGMAEIKRNRSCAGSAGAEAALCVEHRGNRNRTGGKDAGMGGIETGVMGEC
jgi:hypothetical protein